MRRRLFRENLVAGVRKDDKGSFVLTAPCVGLWREAPEVGALLQPGMSLARSRSSRSCTASRSRPARTAWCRPTRIVRAIARRPVEFGEALVRLDPNLATGVTQTDTAAASESTAELTFRAPSSGALLRTPAPDKPPFVNVGDVISTGHTVALLEVMKTFNRIQYGGGSLPERARVVRIVPEDQADLASGRCDPRARARVACSLQGVDPP